MARYGSGSGGRRGVEKETYQTGATGERLRWTSEYGSVTFNLAGREFVWGVMNEAGLVMSSLQLAAGEYPQPDERPALLDGNWGQYVLDTCASVEEIIGTDSFVTVRDQGPPGHYLAADAEGNCVAVEYLDGEVVYYVAAPHTRWSIVFDIVNRDIYYRSDQSPTYKHISMSAFDFSCEAPKLMLDVNAALEGDVQEHFVPYDHDVSLNAFRTFCETWGIKVSEECRQSDAVLRRLRVRPLTRWARLRRETSSPLAAPLPNGRIPPHPRVAAERRPLRHREGLDSIQSEGGNISSIAVMIITTIIIGGPLVNPLLPPSQTPRSPGTGHVGRRPYEECRRNTDDVR